MIAVAKGQQDMRHARQCCPDLLGGKHRIAGQSGIHQQNGGADFDAKT